jgi:phosphatidylserine/phosphatidylglycerophosphate/cardiolipin synthase-like enzyme
MMILEQLVTARTITEYEIWKLVRRYRKLIAKRITPSELEEGRREVGILKIGYFRPKMGEEEPVKLHLKCTMVDDEIAVLGSGNMDRASWWTSQELGIAVFGREVVGEIGRCVEGGLRERIEWVC